MYIESDIPHLFEKGYTQSLSLRHSPFTGEFLTGIPVAAGKYPPPPHTFEQHGACTMNKFDSTKLRTKFDNTSEGLLVQVYSADRRLLCAIDSFHAWTFFVGPPVLSPTGGGVV
ncbi:hypothetical protein QT971_30535 [Microcoleus sp. herbarium19]|uniref:hypothetical protein n=1 Tax=unclassified Microcoleus TaxID=2642155 RepID=UPI002FCEA75D